MTRGEVYWVDLDPVVGSATTRVPCVIVSRNASNRAAATLTVVPISRSVERIYPFDVFLEAVLEQPCKAQANQIRTVNKKRITGPPLARVPDPLIYQLDAALRLHLNV